MRRGKGGCGAAVRLALCLPWLLGLDFLQSRNRATEAGNARMQAGKADEALVQYDKAARALPADPGAHFNRGTALYALGRYAEALPEFLRATEARAAVLKAAAFYNLGNTLFSLHKFGEAIEAYKRSLALDPADLRAKWNLELALTKKQEEEKKQRDQKQEDKQKQGDKQEQARDQPQPKRTGDEEQHAQEGGQEKPQDTPQKPGPQPPRSGAEQPSNVEPQDKAQGAHEIEAILDSLERSPKEIEKARARLRAVRRALPTKDW